VHRASKLFGFKEVGEDEDWNLYWTDFSVSLERVMEMKRYQVSQQQQQQRNSLSLSLAHARFDTLHLPADNNLR